LVSLIYIDPKTNQEVTRVIDAAEPEVTIGRNPQNTIRVNSPSLSRHHAKLSLDPETGQVFIADLNSSNGTYVNGRRIQTQALKAGDDVFCGEFRMRITVEAAQEEPPPGPDATAQDQDEIRSTLSGGGMAWFDQADRSPAPVPRPSGEHAAVRPPPPAQGPPSGPVAVAGPPPMGPPPMGPPPMGPPPMGPPPMGPPPMGPPPMGPGPGAGGASAGPPPMGPPPMGPPPMGPPPMGPPPMSPPPMGPPPMGPPPMGPPPMGPPDLAGPPETVAPSMGPAEVEEEMDLPEVSPVEVDEPAGTDHAPLGAHGGPPPMGPPPMGPPSMGPPSMGPPSMGPPPMGLPSMGDRKRVA
jgi:hypothetical protein